VRTHRLIFSRSKQNKLHTHTQTTTHTGYRNSDGLSCHPDSCIVVPCTPTDLLDSSALQRSSVQPSHSAMPRRDDSSSDSDTEEDKIKQRQMRESVAENSFAADAYKPTEPVNHAANAAAAAAASSAAAVSSATAPAASPHAHNPFYALLHPPVPPFFAFPCPSIPPHLHKNPYRVNFLTKIEQQIREQKQQLERRRRNGLHGLQSNRHTTTDDDALAGTGPRKLNAFEQSMLRQLLAMVERSIDIEEAVWKEETESQQNQRLQAYQSSRQFLVFRRFPPGAFLDSLEANDSTAAAKAGDSRNATVDADKAERKRKKAEKKAAAAVAAGGDTAMETEEQRRARKLAKKEKKRRRLEEAGGGATEDEAARKAAKKQKRKEQAAAE
jgi:hypothetical protein